MIIVADEVAAALREGRPVVALESAVVTTGLPAPAGIEVAGRLQRLARDGGAVPATIGVLAGALRVGLHEDELARLAEAGAGCKASVRDLAAVAVGGGSAGTTVSATLWACRACAATTGSPIRVMATGGIGGVHRGWSQHPDVSADLRVLADVAACVVASGAKSILDVRATLEALETLSVPVLAWRTMQMPMFYCRGTDAVPAPRRADEIDEVASLCHTHWSGLGGGGVLLANPVPAGHALDAAALERHLEAAERAGADLPPPQRTPHLLRWLAEATGGRAVEANTALLADNTRLAAALAVALAQRA